MKQFFARGLVLMAGVVSVPVSGPTTALSAPAPDYREDPRTTKLGDFFRRYSCPAGKYTQVFLEAADRYALDWRLLPSISYIESTCGKAARNNNFFGWDSGRASFPSPAAAIHEVARRITQSARYRNKNLDGILTVYNPRAEWAQKVKSAMRLIADFE